MRPSSTDARAAQTVIGAGALLIGAHLALLAWALYPSWFYLDDFFLLSEAPSDLSLASLGEPHDSQLMPLGRLVAWLVATGSHWVVAATGTLLLQALASVSCLWLLVTLFGARPGVLVPLAVYLSSAMTMSSTMWWAASLNALPLQLAFFAAVGCWFRHQRTRRTRWLVATLVAIALGLSAYVKALFLVPLLLALSVAYFADGSLTRRVRTVLSRDRAAVVILVACGTAYAVTYFLTTPRLVSATPIDVVLPLARRMLLEALTVGLVGGPWRWDDTYAPTSVADAPWWAVAIALVALLGLAVYGAIRRLRTGRAWALFGGYVAAAFLLVLMTRAPLVGSIAGLEYRYLSDVTCAWVLTIGLVTLPLVDTDRGSAPRPDARPLSTPYAQSIAPVLTVALVVGSGLVSSVRYVIPWHEQNPGEQYLRTAAVSLQGAGRVDLADGVVPDRVIPGYQFPRNRLEYLLPTFVSNVHFPDHSDDLVVLDDRGDPHRAIMDVAVSVPPGPDGDCGTRVTSKGATFALPASTIDYAWWVRLGYLGFREDVVEVRLADHAFEVPIRRGLHSAWLRVDGIVSTVTIEGMAPGNVLCVDTVEVGEPAPGAPL